MDIEVEQLNQDQDTNLIPIAAKVTPQASPTPIAEQVLSEKGDIILLGDHLGTKMYNITFDESQYKFVQACRAHTPDEHASPAYLEERVIVSDVQKHPVASVDATNAYAKSTNSCVRLLIAENECMAKELQATKQREE